MALFSFLCDGILVSSNSTICRRNICLWLLSRKKECTIPYDKFCVVAAVTFALMGSIAWMLLSYGRHHIASSAMSLQLSDMSTLNAEDSTHSHISDNGVVFQVSRTKTCLSLTMLWCLLGLVLGFAFVWGVVGFFWLTNKSACDKAMEGVSLSCFNAFFMYLYHIFLKVSFLLCDDDADGL